MIAPVLEPGLVRQQARLLSSLNEFPSLWRCSFNNRLSFTVVLADRFYILKSSGGPSGWFRATVRTTHEGELCGCISGFRVTKDTPLKR